MTIQKLAPIALCALAACVSPPPPSVAGAVRRIPVAVELGGLHPRVLELRIQRGHVLVTGQARLSCELYVDLPAGLEGRAEELAREMRLSSWGDTDGVLRLLVEPPAGLPLDVVHASYTLGVPDDVELRVFSAEADITVRGYGGDALLRTESGRVRAWPGGGRCRIENGRGATWLGGDYLAAEIASDGGIVEVALPDHGGGRELKLATVSGPIRLCADRDDRVELVFDTRSGVVLSELPVRWIREEQAPDKAGVRYHGQLGDGDGARISVTSLDGNLQLIRRPGDPGRRGADGPAGSH